MLVADGSSTSPLEVYLGTSLLRFYFYPLCYAALVLKFTYYAQYYDANIMLKN